MGIVISTRLKRFVEGFVLGENEDVISMHLKDIDESFFFNSEASAQNFLNRQTSERFGDNELKLGYFDYEDEYGIVHRYIINKLYRGKIVSYTEEIIEGQG